MRNPSSSAAATRGRGGGGGGKTTPCCSKVGLKRGPWTAEEDEVLASYIRREGEGGWRTLPSRAGLLRCGKSCRLRWMNYLRPSVKRGQIAPDEEDLILRLHRLLGNRWSLIAGRIPGRTDNEIKNYWNTHLSKKLIGQGIDPRTHKPLQLNPNSSTSPSTSTPPAAPRPHPQPHPPPINDNNMHRHLRSPPSSSRPPNIPLVRNPNIIPPPLPLPSNEESPRFLSNSRTNPYLDEDGTGFNVANGGTTADLDISPMLGLRSSSKIGKGLLRLYGEDGEEKEEEDDINRCGEDDAFSSFLNSLINEEPFAGQHQLVLGGGASPATATATTDALNISSSAAQVFGLIDPSWETASLPSPPPSTLHDQQTDHQLRIKYEHKIDHDKHF